MKRQIHKEHLMVWVFSIIGFTSLYFSDSGAFLRITIGFLFCATISFSVLSEKLLRQGASIDEDIKGLSLDWVPGVMRSRKSSKLTFVCTDSKDNPVVYLTVTATLPVLHDGEPKECIIYRSHHPYYKDCSDKDLEAMISEMENLGGGDDISLDNEVYLSELHREQERRKAL